MARTQTNESQLKDRVLTGASFNSLLGIYDETFDYGNGDQVFWKNEKYTSSTNIVGVLEGDLTQAPDISGNWTLQENAVYNVYPSTSMTLDVTRKNLVLDTERSTSAYFSLSGGNLVCNASGKFIAYFNLSTDVTSASRRTSTGFLQIDTGSGFNDVQNAEIYMYNRSSANGKDTGSCAVVLDVNAGDVLRIQLLQSVGTDCVTIETGCNLTIFGVDTVSGPKGLKGDDGPSGDIVWLGAFVAGTYNIHDTVEYQGSSYTCINNGTTSTPPSADWELVAQKGSSGAGATVNVSEDGTLIPNTPHDSFNFTSPLTAVDAGSGVADIGIDLPKNTYMTQVWAEENSALSNTTYEWAYGNGASTGSTGGVTMYVEPGYTCALVAMTSTLRQGTAEIEFVLNGNPQGSSASVSGGAGSNSNTMNLVVANGDLVNFRTLTQSGTGGPNTICAYFKFTEV